LHELEIASVLERRCAAGDISRETVRRIWRALEEDLGKGVLCRVEVDWTMVFGDAVKWVRRQAGGLRALDGLHLSCALHLKSKTLVTFDQRQARAAARAGLNTLGAKG
jgi:predicted nucleic acid-binding protein